MQIRHSPSALLGLALLLVPAAGHTDDDIFELTEIPSPGRSVAAELRDLNGDGRTDLFVVALDGLPPEEERTIRVYLQGEDGQLPKQPSHEVAVPRWSAVYDIADLVAESPGEELVLLQPEGVMLLSLGDASGRRWFRPVPGPSTFAAADDERGLEHLRMVDTQIASEPWILVPQIGRMTAITADGTVRASLALPRRANFLVLPETGLASIESNFQMYVDSPNLAVGDVDGDGRVDLVASTRHELRVFLQRQDGSFPEDADRKLALRMMTKRDHIRGSGGVACDMRDFDDDGRLDLLISHVNGTITDAEVKVYVFRNHGSGWNLEQPDQTFEGNAGVGTHTLIDLDDDGRLELVRAELEVGVFEMVELLLSRAFDVEIAVHRTGEDGLFDEKPWFRRKISVPLDFETFRPKGFIPRTRVDLNGDSLLDFVASGNGDAFVVHLGGPGGLFDGDRKKQSMPTDGVLRFGDLDGDSLPDFLLVDRHHFDSPIRIGRNRGRLPGSPARIGPGG